MIILRVLHYILLALSIPPMLTAMVTLMAGWGVVLSAFLGGADHHPVFGILAAWWVLGLVYALIGWSIEEEAANNPRRHKPNRPFTGSATPNFSAPAIAVPPDLVGRRPDDKVVSEALWEFRKDMRDPDRIRWHQ